MTMKISLPTTSSIFNLLHNFLNNIETNISWYFPVSQLICIIITALLLYASFFILKLTIKYILMLSKISTSIVLAFQKL